MDRLGFGKLHGEKDKLFMTMRAMAAAPPPEAAPDQPDKGEKKPPVSDSKPKPAASSQIH